MYILTDDKYHSKNVYIQDKTVQIFDDKQPLRMLLIDSKLYNSLSGTNDIMNTKTHGQLPMLYIIQCIF